MGQSPRQPRDGLWYRRRIGERSEAYPSRRTLLHRRNGPPCGPYKRLTSYSYRFSVHKHELDIGFAGQFIFDESFAADVSSTAFHTDGRGFQNELIAGDDRVAHLDFIHAKENSKLAGVLQLLTEQEAAELGHRLDDQNAGHDRRAGVMALEKDVVEGDV